MKATFMLLATLLVSTLTLNAASAQSPYPVVPSGYGYPGFGAVPYTAGYAGPAQAAPAASCANCESGKGTIFGKKSTGCDSCGKKGLFQKNDCSSCKGGICGCFKGWLCKPNPSTAPVLQHAEYPLGFPQHPYVRSPRDYFMTNDP